MIPEEAHESNSYIMIDGTPVTCELVDMTELTECLTDDVRRLVKAFADFTAEIALTIEETRKFRRAVYCAYSDNRRVIHLALYHKKARVRKKNIRRIYDFEGA